jgi:hypothetical protein
MDPFSGDPNPDDDQAGNDPYDEGILNQRGARTMPQKAAHESTHGVTIF